MTNPDIVYKIGTRDSPLAMWQAETVQALLASHGITTELYPVKSQGDLDLVTPLYSMGVQGVFTKTLDAYLLSNKIDIAVHSMKDVPVQLAQGIVKAAVLQRGPTEDVIVWKNGEILSEEFLQNNVCTIGTGSIRRSSQWLQRYPHHKVENLRGNVQTRLRKVEESNWIGAIFAKAGLERMEYHDIVKTPLEWMIPAPAQGAIMVVCHQDNTRLQELLSVINHTDTDICAGIERTFLSTLEGGCSTPIGASAVITEGDQVLFKGIITNIEGTKNMVIEEQYTYHPSKNIGAIAAQQLLSQGAGMIVEEIRNSK